MNICTIHFGVEAHGAVALGAAEAAFVVVLAQVLAGAAAEAAGALVEDAFTVEDAFGNIN